MERFCSVDVQKSALNLFMSGLRLFCLLLYIDDVFRGPGTFYLSMSTANVIQLHIARKVGSQTMVYLCRVKHEHVAYQIICSHVTSQRYTFII